MFVLADTESGKNHTFATLDELSQWVSKQIQPKETSLIKSIIQSVLNPIGNVKEEPNVKQKENDTKPVQEKQESKSNKKGPVREYDAAFEKLIPEDLRNMPYKSNNQIKEEMIQICREAQETKKEIFKKIVQECKDGASDVITKEAKPKVVFETEYIPFNSVVDEQYSYVENSGNAMFNVFEKETSEKNPENKNTVVKKFQERLQEFQNELEKPKRKELEEKARVEALIENIKKQFSQPITSKPNTGFLVESKKEPQPTLQQKEQQLKDLNISYSNFPSYDIINKFFKDTEKPILPTEPKKDTKEMYTQLFDTKQEETKPIIHDKMILAILEQTERVNQEKSFLFSAMMEGKAVKRDEQGKLVIDETKPIKKLSRNDKEQLAILFGIKLDSITYHHFIEKLDDSNKSELFESKPLDVEGFTNDDAAGHFATPETSQTTEEQKEQDRHEIEEVGFDYKSLIKKVIRESFDETKRGQEETNKQLELIYSAMKQGKKLKQDQEGNLVIDEKSTSVNINDLSYLSFELETFFSKINNQAEIKDLPLFTEIVKENPECLNHLLQKEEPTTVWDRSHFNRISGQENRTFNRALPEEVSEQIFIQDDEESATMTTTDTKNDDSLSSAYYKQTIHVGGSYLKKEVDDGCKLLFPWFLNKFTDFEKGTDVQQMFENIEDVRYCWKLFLLNPAFCHQDYDNRFSLMNDAPKEYWNVVQNGRIHKALLEQIAVEIPKERKIIFDVYFKQYKAFLDKITPFNLLNEMRPFLYQLLVGCFIDKKVHPSVMRSWVSFFCQIKLNRKKGNMIQSSEMYTKWIDFLKDIFESDSEVWPIVQASTNTRQFSRDMKHNGFFTRRRSVGILYEDVEFSTQGIKTTVLADGIHSEGWNAYDTNESEFSVFEK